MIFSRKRIFARKRKVKLRAEHAENAGILRIIALAMAWAAGIALGVASGDLAIAILLTGVMSAGHLVSWRTRTWRSARWQIALLVPVSLVGILLVPSLPQAFQGDWLHPMRYLLLLQALASFYLHSRASLYTAQVLSGIVLLVSSQLAFDSLFLTFFFAFFGLQLVFMVAAARVDATRGAIGRAPGQGVFARAAWSLAGVAVLSVVSLGVFMILPWGSLSVSGESSSILPLTGEAEPSGAADASTRGPAEILPLSGDADTQAAADTSGGQAQPGGLPELSDVLSGLSTLRESGGDGSDPFGSTNSPSGDLFESQPMAEEVLTLQAPAEGGENPTIMQVRSPMATYWRGRTYSWYDGTEWLPDRSLPMERATRTERFRYTQTYFLREELSAPVFGYSQLAWLPVGDAGVDRTLGSGDVYRAISERRNFHPVVLERAAGNIFVSSSQSSRFPKSVNALAKRVTAGSASSLDKALAITQFLRGNYRFVRTEDPWAPAQTIEQFLFGEHKAGNAMDFASAQTALAVASGLDARLVTGYLPGELDPLSGTYVVRASDAHAWTEVNFRSRVGWVPFDGNPRDDGQANTADRGGAAGAVAGLFAQRVGGQVREATREAIEDTASLAGKLLRPAGIALVVVALAWLTRWIIRRRRHGASDYSLLMGDGRREVVRAYARLMRDVRGKVDPRLPHETSNEYFARLAQSFPHMWEQRGWLRSKLNEAAYRPTTQIGASTAETQERFRQASRGIRSNAGA